MNKHQAVTWHQFQLPGDAVFEGSQLFCNLGAMSNETGNCNYDRNVIGHLKKIITQVK